MRKSTSIASLLLFIALLAMPTLTTAQSRPIFLYSAKFVCGKANDERIVSPGEYFTLINVHNSSPAVPMRYLKRFALALPGEKAGKISQVVVGGLGPDEAMSIECENIYKHTGTSPGQFIEGFALLYSLVELDVVAVYTAGHTEVETLHSERVPVRRFFLRSNSDLGRRMFGK